MVWLRVGRHSDFEKIRAAFLKHYSKDPKLGESRYAAWVSDSGLDESKSYYAQAAALCRSRQSFVWAQFLLQFVKEDQDACYYKVEALFPVESMNGAVFTKDECLQSARTLTGKPSNLNHDPAQLLEGVEVVAAQFEDDCVECLVRVPKSSSLVGMIERKEIVNVSIEGDWSHGVPGQGLVLTGLGWLTKDAKLPGIPLTRIMPVEQIVESFSLKAAKSHAAGCGCGCGASVSGAGGEQSAASQGKRVVKASVEAYSRWNLPKVRFVCRGKNPCPRCAALNGKEFVAGTEPDLPLHDGCQCGYENVSEGAREQGSGDEVGCVFCGSAADFIVSVCQVCFNKMGGSKLEKADLKQAVKEALKEAVDQLKCPACGQVFDYFQWQNSNWRCPNKECVVEVVPPEPTVLRPRGEPSAAEKLAAAEATLQEKSTKLAEVETRLTEAVGKLQASEQLAEQLRKQVPGGGLLKDPPKMMPVSECLERLTRLDLPKMLERLSQGNMMQAHKVRKEIFEVKQKYGVA